MSSGEVVGREPDGATRTYGGEPPPWGRRTFREQELLERALHLSGHGRFCLREGMLREGFDAFFKARVLLTALHTTQWLRVTPRSERIVPRTDAQPAAAHAARKSKVHGGSLA